MTTRRRCGTFTKAGYAPMVTGDPEEALGFMEEGDPHLALLDLVLPGVDGIELMRDIRAIANIRSSSWPLTARKMWKPGPSTWEPTITSSSPSRPRSWRPESGRPLRKRAALGQGEPSEPYVRGDLVIDYAGRSVSVGGRPVRLTATEYRLLVELSANAGKTLTYDHLLERVWERRGGGGDLRPMRSAGRSLRRKLGDDANNPTYIFTEPRVGYLMPKGERQDAEKQ